MPTALEQHRDAPTAAAAKTRAQLRRFPYPYRAMLAFCSDLDETPLEGIYFELMRFLSTKEQTQFGIGAGLEVGNTIYFDMAPGHFSYWNATEAERARIRELIRSGHIDCLHSFGDLATTRAHAAKALDELARHDCFLKVWIDHAVAPTNLGKDIMRGHGDEPGHAAYHSDLTTQYGVRYVWRGRVTSVTGQDQPVSFSGIMNPAHPIASGKTLGKEIAKHFLAATKPEGKYGLHRGNPLLRPARLSCGAPVHEFLRSNPHWRGVSCCDTGWGVQEVLTKSFFDRLVKRDGAAIVYSHIGKLNRRDGKPAFSPGGAESFHLLAEEQRAGRILVATTHRILNYHRVRDSVEAFQSSNGGIEIRTDEPLENLQGVTIYTDRPQSASIVVNGRSVPTRENAADESGRHSVSFEWKPLAFPA